jgi:hypothetical protein
VQGKPWSGDILGTDADPIYQTERYFPARDAHRAFYRIPLPRGRYRVTLGFAEGYYRTRGKRRFDVLIEGEVLTNYEPLQSGFATRDVRTFEIRVDDGALDIRFVHRVDHPMISAIEIETIE